MKITKDFGYNAEIEALNIDKLALDVVECLNRKKLMIATAESCTGGMLAELITSVPGASEIFELGIVSYSDGVKAEILGVSPQTLKKHTAVSPETAAEMSRAVLKNYNISVSVTGYADTAPEGSRAGTVYVGVSYRSGFETATETYLLRLWEFLDVSRGGVRLNTARFAFSEVLRLLNNVF